MKYLGLPFPLSPAFRSSCLVIDSIRISSGNSAPRVNTNNSLARASAERRSLDSIVSGAVVVGVAAVVVDADAAAAPFPADLSDAEEEERAPPPSLELPASGDSAAGPGAGC